MRLTEYQVDNLLLGIIGVAVALVVGVCVWWLLSDYTMDRGACLQEQTQLVSIPQYTTVCTGNSCSMQFTGMLLIPVQTCARWQYPDGKKVEPKPSAD